MSTHPAPPFEIVGAGRLAVGSPQALSELRRDVFRSVGPRYGTGILYGIGFTEGLIDALRVVQSFDGQGRGRGEPQLAGPVLPLLFEPSHGRIETRFAGALHRSIEAELHAHSFSAAQDPICFVTAGYAAGWYTELLDAQILVKETTCVGRGDAHCSFEARRLDDWTGDASMAEILPYLDISALRARARSAAAAQDSASMEDGDDEAMMCSDPSSPAVHVWGPVMVLPYSGADDCSVAIDTIVGDIGAGQVRVVLVDLLGMRLDSIEAAGLTQLLAYVRGHEMESIVVGISRLEGSRLGVPVTSTLCVPDMAEGIALSFQMLNDSRC